MGLAFLDLGHSYKQAHVGEQGAQDFQGRRRATSTAPASCHPRASLATCCSTSLECAPCMLERLPRSDPSKPRARYLHRDRCGVAASLSAVSAFACRV